MREFSKRRASLLVSALVIFTYASTNLKHAKKQEEGIHAHYLARSACEIAHHALWLESKNGAALSGDSGWENLVNTFTDASSAYLDKYSYCISSDGSVTEPGYANQTKFEPGVDGTNLDPEISKALENSVMLIKVSRVPLSSFDEDERQYRGFLRIEGRGRTGINGSYNGEAKCVLYVDAKNQFKMYWR